MTPERPGIKGFLNAVQHVLNVHDVSVIGRADGGRPSGPGWRSCLVPTPLETAGGRGLVTPALCRTHTGDQAPPSPALPGLLLPTCTDTGGRPRGLGGSCAPNSDARVQIRTFQGASLPV